MYCARVQGLRLKPRVSPWVVPLSAACLTVATSIGAASTGALEALLPFTGLPILAAFAYFSYARRPRALTVSVERGELRLEGYERHPLRLKAREVLRKRWVQPVLGTRQGDALVIRGVTPEGRARELSFGVVGGQSARATDPTCDQVDISLGGAEFAQLTRELPIPPVPEANSQVSHATFVLVPHRGAGAAFGQMLPWFGTLVFVGILGALGEPLMQTAWGRVVLFGAVIAAVGGGLVFTFRRASKPKPETLLRLSMTTLTLGDEEAPSLRLPISDLNLTSELYVYRTKYGTFRFPVLVLSDGTQQLRVGVWEDSASVGVPLAPEGAAPDYLLSAHDYRAFLRQLQQTGATLS